MSENKKEIKVLKQDTELLICLAKKHPKDAMNINGVTIRGYQPKLYTIPAGTNLESKEVVAWFKIEAPVKEAKTKIKDAPKPPQE